MTQHDDLLSLGILFPAEYAPESRLDAEDIEVPAGDPRANHAVHSLGPLERGTDQGFGRHRLECGLLTEQVKVVARRHVHQPAPPA